MSIVVLGSSGQLATHLRQLLPDAQFWGRGTVDLAQLHVLQDRLRSTRPRAVINAAAYTAVDAAQGDTDAAWRINAEAPGVAARAAAAVGASFVQISTDYVFDGRADSPYQPDAAVNPLGVYGASKLGGELAVRTLCPRHWILRTSWVFSEFGANFVKTVLRLAGSGKPMRIVADQQGQPTYAGDLAAAIAALDVTAAEPSLPFGTYHATGGPVVSWHGFAERIVELAVERGLLEQTVPVQPITTAEFGAPAPRPLFGVLAPSAALEAHGGSFDWQRGLRDVLVRMRES